MRGRKGAQATLMLSLVLMASLFCMILAAVALIQYRVLFKFAPKDIEAAAPTELLLNTR